LARYIYLLMDKAGVTSLDSQRQFRIKMTEAMRREQDEFSA
jgi:hypothetical protein